MPTKLEHFSAITLAVIQDLTNKGILQLIAPGPDERPLALDSQEAKDMITNITTSLLEGTVNDMNQHLAPKLIQEQI